MADTKISALPASTTPLAGTETLPIVQGGVTKKVSVADLTAGRAVASAGGTFSDNLTQGTAAKGVNFTANTPKPGMASQLLNWYETGTFTPNLTFGGGNTGMTGTFTGNYTRVGNQVTVDIRIALTAKGSSTGIAVIGALPFTAKAYPCAVIDASSGVNGPAATWLGAVSGTDMYLFYQDASTRTLFNASNFTDSADLRLGLTYLV